MIHPVRQLAKAIVGANTSGTPLRHARGVVVSSNQGTTVVTLDGGSTNVTAFNYGHAQNLAAGTVVDVLVVGRKAYVLGAYTSSGDNTWTNFGALSGAWTVVTQPAYIKLGRAVYLRGTITGGTINTACFTLPSGYWPSQLTGLAVNSNGGAAAQLNIGLTGAVTPATGSPTNFNLYCSFPVV